MTSYDERLTEFARGRTFVRLKRPLANRRDGSCDACRSPQPRVLHGLKDETSGRYAFVGGDCLRALVDRGAVDHGALRERIEEAYEREMASRRHAAPPGHGAPRTAPSAAAAPLNDHSTPSVPTVLLVVAVLQPAEGAALLGQLVSERSQSLLVRSDADPMVLTGLIAPLAQLLETTERVAESG